MTPEQWSVWTGLKFDTDVLPENKVRLPKPSEKYEFATLSDLQASLKKLRGE